MRKALFFLLFIFGFSNAFSQSQVEPNQILAELIPTKKWFEIEQFYQNNKTQITSDFVKLWYTAETGKIFNQFDASILAYEDLIFKNPQKKDTYTLITSYAQDLLSTCGLAQNYEKGIEVSKKLISLIENDTVIENSIKQSYIDGFKQVIISFNQLKITIPKTIVIDKQPQSEGTIQLEKLNKNENEIFFRAKWNNKTHRTIFDTGSGYCYIWNREVAKNIGVKFNSQDTILLNGNIKTLFGTIDSLEMGKFLIKNVPVFVSMEEIDRNDPKQVRCDSIMNSDFDVVLGLNIIMKLDVIEYDRLANTLSFPKKDANKSTLARNMFVENYGIINLKMNVSDQDFIALFDTGNGGGLNINSEFYNKNRQNIKIHPKKEKRTGMVGGCNEVSFDAREVFECKKIKVQINDDAFTLKKDCDVSVDKENDYILGSSEGGALGCAIFNYGKKAIFDFENMNFSIVK